MRRLIVWVRGRLSAGGRCMCMGHGTIEWKRTTHEYKYSWRHSRGLSSYRHFPYKVVGKYWPSFRWPPAVAQWIPVGLLILLVTPEDLFHRRLQRRYLLLALEKALPSKLWRTLFFLLALAKAPSSEKGRCPLTSDQRHHLNKMTGTSVEDDFPLPDGRRTSLYSTDLFALCTSGDPTGSPLDNLSN